MNVSKPFLQFTVATVLLGTSFTAIGSGLDAIPPVLFAALRFDIGALLLLGLVATRFDSWLPRTRRDVAAILVSGALVVGLNNALLFVGQQYTTSGAAAVMYGLMPVVSPVFALAVLGTRVSAGDLAGILIGLAGVVVIVDPTPATFGGPTLAGQALIVVAALSVSLGSVLVRWTGPDLRTLPMSAWAMLVGAFGLHVTSLVLGESMAVAWTPQVVAAAMYVGGPGTAVAYAAYFLLVAESGPVQANLVALAVPAVATISGWAVLGEQLASTTVLGFGVILLGFAVFQREELRSRVEASTVGVQRGVARIETFPNDD
ncbi:MAG: DMT family transporter [Halobacteriota archaeon]